jgi:hypothetical protein
VRSIDVKGREVKDGKALMYKTLGGLIIFLFLQEEEKIGERKIRKISSESTV